MEGDDVAIFWDYENVSAAAKEINVPIAESLLAYSETIGYPSIKKVYSNWRSSTGTISKALYSLGFDTIQVSMGKENSVDVKLTVDCMDIAFKNPEIKHFIIVTGDKDYVSLVCWLRNNKKNVIIIGKTETVSEHLMLSANSFVPLEELPAVDIGTSIDESKQETVKLIKFQEAVSCLKEAISLAREQGKSTRYTIIGAIMRTIENYNYHGANSVLKSKTETFKTFSSFLSQAEEQNLIKIQMVEGFKEIFLPEEDPVLESEFSPKLQEEITKEHWTTIIEKVIEAFHLNVGKEFYGTFGSISKSVRQAKQEGLLPFSNRKLNEYLDKLIELGFLIKQDDGTYTLNDEQTKSIDELLVKLSLVKL